MKIAVTYENGNVFPHFGHTEQFKVYDVEDGKVTGTQVVETKGSGHGALAGMLSGLEVDTLICGGIGAGAQIALAEAGIRLYGGVSGNTDEAVDALLAGNLAFDPEFIAIIMAMIMIMAADTTAVKISMAAEALARSRSMPQGVRARRKNVPRHILFLCIMYIDTLYTLLPYPSGGNF